MRRVLIVGSGGSGKTTLAKRVAEVTGLPVIHLDAHYWKPGWTPSSAEEWSDTVDQLTSGEEWIMDGNYGGTMDQRFAACDAVVFLDVPRLVCIRRLIQRRFSHRGAVRPEMAAGCPERLSLEFLLYIWRYPSSRRPGVMQRLERLPTSKPSWVLKTQGDIDDFVGQLRT